MPKIYTLFFMFIGISFQISAQSKIGFDSTQNELKEVVITYQADKLTPITYQNIYSKELKYKSIGQEPSFLLAETPSITNYSDAGSANGYSYFRIRGIDQTRINIIFDGVPLNEPEDQGAYFSNYPDLFNSLSQLQIQRGIGITQNGVASYGGGIQLSSPNLSEAKRANVGLSYGSFNTLRTFAEYSSGINKGKAFYARASNIQSDGYKYHSSNSSQSLLLSGGVFRNKSIWKANFLAGKQRNELAWLGVADSLIHIDPRTNGNSTQEKDRFFQTLTQIQNSWQINTNSSIQSGLYHTFLQGGYEFDYNNFVGLPLTEELYRYGFLSNFVGLFSNYTLSKDKLKWTSGIHVNKYARKHIGSEKSLGVLYENTGFKNEMSVYTKASYTHKWLTIYGDVQYRNVEFDYVGSTAFQGLSWRFFNPKVGFTSVLKNETKVYYSLGRIGREPTRNDMFGGNDDLLADISGNPILSNTSPEYVIDQEIGVRYEKEKTRLYVNLYLMNFENEIVLEGKFGPNGLPLTNNVERSFRTGLELTFAYKLSSCIQLVNNSSFNYSRIKAKNEWFSPILTPPVIINQEINFTKNKWVTGVSARYQASSFIDFANEARINGYFFVNSRVGMTIQDIQVALHLNNLTNATYFNQAYIDFDGTTKYFVQSPINGAISINYSIK